MGEMAEIVLDSLNHPPQHHPRQCTKHIQINTQVNLLIQRGPKARIYQLVWFACFHVQTTHEDKNYLLIW